MWTRSAIGHRLSAIGRAVRKLFGMPDYVGYLEHRARCHAETPLLSEKEFVRIELERKYAGGGGRCC
jgi:uncharacterized short protein YbdD (DUF466 family)